MIDNELKTLRKALATLAEGFSDLPAFKRDFDWAAMDEVLQQAAEKMRDNYPYGHPLYAGQMLKPPHPIARMAYAMSMWINPNNHALDGGRASSAMELECIASLGEMFGLEKPLGHLCGGGTMANLEACIRVKPSSPRHRRTTHIRGSVKCSASISPPSRLHLMAAWTSAPWKNGSRRAKSERLWRHSVRPAWVPWIPCPASSICVTNTIFDCTSTPRTAVIFTSRAN
jgi:hypothetical protein